MYTMNFLLELTHKFNTLHVKGDYDITIEHTGNKKSPFRIAMITEEGNSHKYAGNMKECSLYLLNCIDVITSN